MSQQRILVVEDYEPLLVGVQDILEAEGYAVFTATDGAQALQMMEEVRPDLIVADIMMPTMDGYTLYEVVRARPEWTSIPVIFLTSRAEKEDLLKGKNLGVEGYITKPFEPKQLLETVRTLLEQARATREDSESA
jgi:DNA-binding response OmpR family regulator